MNEIMKIKIGDTLVFDDDLKSVYDIGESIKVNTIRLSVHNVNESIMCIDTMDSVEKILDFIKNTMEEMDSVELYYVIAASEDRGSNCENFINLMIVSKSDMGKNMDLWGNFEDKIKEIDGMWMLKYDSDVDVELEPDYHIKRTNRTLTYTTIKSIPDVKYYIELVERCGLETHASINIPFDSIQDAQTYIIRNIKIADGDWESEDDLCLAISKEKSKPKQTNNKIKTISYYIEV